MNGPNQAPPEPPAPQDSPVRPVRKVPNMRVVTKGWWVLREESVPLEILQQEDRDKRKDKR